MSYDFINVLHFTNIRTKVYCPVFERINFLNSKYLHISREKCKMAAAYKVSISIYMVKKETYFF